MSKDGGSDKTSDWTNKLMGKKIGESSNETVRITATQRLFEQIR